MQGGSDLRYARTKYKASRVVRLYVLLVVLHCDSTVLYCSAVLVVLYQIQYCTIKLERCTGTINSSTCDFLFGFPISCTCTGTIAPSYSGFLFLGIRKPRSTSTCIFCTCTCRNRKLGKQETALYRNRKLGKQETRKNGGSDSRRNRAGAHQWVVPL